MSAVSLLIRSVTFRSSCRNVSACDDVGSAVVVAEDCVVEVVDVVALDDDGTLMEIFSVYR